MTQRMIVAALALALLIAVFQDAFEVMLLPRRVQRQFRFTRYYFDLAWAGWSAMARGFAPGARRERFLSIFGALSMVVLFALWGGALIVGFGALHWAIQRGDAHPSTWTEQVYMSGVTFFTLGYGDVVPHSGLTRLLAVIEAGAGIGFIAVVIGYLPVLYQLFSRREAHVIQLDARAGSPPTAATMLQRHAESDGMHQLDDLLREWEVWGSELLESHLSYPMLVYYRSQHDNQSWLAALATVMDVCALVLVGVEDVAPLQARMTFAMARQIMVEMARTLGVSPARYEGYDRLPRQAFSRLEAMFAETGVNWAGGPDAEETLAALRATYEPLLAGLASRLLLTVPEWIRAEDAADHWEHGHRGMIARRLLDQLATRSLAEPTAAPDHLSRTQRLRARLRRRRGPPPP